MRGQEKSMLLLLMTVVMTLGALSVLNSQTHDPTLRKSQSAFDETQFPIVDESAAEPADPQKRARREAKGRKFHGNVKITSIPNFQVAATVTHWPSDFPSLPVEKSSGIIVGEVVDAKAFVSTDWTAVYSEFMIKSSQVLKDCEESGIAPNSTVIITRYGGRVRFPDGGIQLLYRTGLGMPRVGGQYLLFLERDEYDFELVTGYELSTGRVVPLDQGTPNFSAHENLEAAEFIKLVQEKIAESASARSSKEGNHED